MKQYLKRTYLCDAGVIIADSLRKLLIDCFCVEKMAFIGTWTLRLWRTSNQGSRLLT